MKIKMLHKLTTNDPKIGVLESKKTYEVDDEYGAKLVKGKSAIVSTEAVEAEDPSE